MTTKLGQKPLIYFICQQNFFGNKEESEKTCAMTTELLYKYQLYTQLID